MQPIDYIAELHCACGNSTRLIADTPKELLEYAAIWDAAHSGEGHRRCSPEEARQARGEVEIPVCEVEE